MNYGDMFITAGSETFRDATFSDCLQYRYTLSRTWDADKPMALFVMLNPSTADAAKDDPTIRRCIAFAKSWDMGGLMVVNLFAWRATDPDELRAAADPVGRENNEAIGSAVQQCRGPIVAAWGAHKLAVERAAQVRRKINHRQIMCLGKTKDGYPRHPLYVKGNAQLIELWPQRETMLAEHQRVCEEEMEGPLVAAIRPAAEQGEGE